MFTGTVNFNSRYGCQKCTTIGEYDTSSRTMCFPNIKAKRRTDLMFRQKEQPKHHKETSLFEELSINMVSSFTVSDSLHLLDLGVMKRCLLRWIGKTKKYERKWNQNLIDSTSQLLLQCNEQKPSDIHRAIRDLNTIKHWKGVEFRTILLYAGMVVLQPALNSDEYEHFLTLCCAVTICSCDKYKMLIPLAGKMFNVYIKKYIELYGKKNYW